MVTAVAAAAAIFLFHSHYFILFYKIIFCAITATRPALLDVGAHSYTSGWSSPNGAIILTLSRSLQPFQLAALTVVVVVMENSGGTHCYWRYSCLCVCWWCRKCFGLRIKFLAHNLFRLHSGIIVLCRVIAAVSSKTAARENTVRKCTEIRVISLSAFISTLST